MEKQVVNKDCKYIYFVLIWPVDIETHTVYYRSFILVSVLVAWDANKHRKVS